jgi:DNA-binding protein H-NS
MKFTNDALKDGAALIAGMELSYLQQLQTMLVAEISKREKETKREAITKIMNLAATAGIALEDLIKSQAKPIKKTGAVPAPIKFRHPEDSNLEWTGRGRHPQWVKDWNEKHGNTDALLVG